MRITVIRDFEKSENEFLDDLLWKLEADWKLCYLCVFDKKNVVGLRIVCVTC